MKKRVIGSIGGALIVIGVVVAFFFMNEKETRPAQQKKLEEYQVQKEEEPVDFSVNYLTEISKEEEEQAMKDIQNLLDHFYGIAYSYKDSSSDMIEEMAAYYASDEISQKVDRSCPERMKQVFDTIHMNSSYQDFTMKSVQFSRTDAGLRASIIGYINTVYSNDEVEQGQYSIVGEVVVGVENGEWKILWDNFEQAFQAETLRTYYSDPGKSGYSFLHKGKSVQYFNFADPDAYTREEIPFDPSDHYDEVRDYTD